MKYVEGNLSTGETVEYSARISKWVLLIPALFAAIFVLIGLSAIAGANTNNTGVGILNFFIAAIILLPSFIRLMTTEMAVTNKNVIAKTGFISRKTIEMSLPRVESIQVHQGILGRILNYGTIIVSGAGNPQAPIKGISQPLNYRRAVLRLQEESVKGQTATAAA